MTNNFRFKSVLASNAAADIDDIFVVRKTLHAAGVPVEIDKPYTSTELFDGIRDFQFKHGLKVDGEIKPGGSTEKTLKHYLKFANLTRCRECGVLHGGVHSAFLCADCFGKLRR